MPPRNDPRTTPQQIAELYEQNRQMQTLIMNLTERVAALEAASADEQGESS